MAQSRIVAADLSVGHGEKVVQQHLSFDIAAGAVFALIGPSGCGKSTLLRCMMGLLAPLSGKIQNYPTQDANGRDLAPGVLFQSGALWSAMTVAQNVAMPMRQIAGWDRDTIASQVDFKLSLVGLGDAANLYPDALSGGMRKRAALARALALDPDLLLLDEPSAGLDPIAARRLDRLILGLRDGLGVTIVLVSHDVSSLLAVADDAVFLDPETKTAIGRGRPRDLTSCSDHPLIQEFFSGTTRQAA